MTASKATRFFLALPLLAYILLNIADYTEAVSSYTANGVSTTIAGDVIVSKNSTSWRCDRISCPRGTDRCRVNKSKSPQDPTKLIRYNACLSADGVELVAQQFVEDIPENVNENLNLIVTSSGSSLVQENGSGGYSSGYSNVNGEVRELTPEEAEEINRKVNAEVENAQENVRQSLEEAQENLRRNLEQARENMEEAFNSIDYRGFGSFW